MRRRVQPTEFIPDGDYPDRPGVQSPTRALDAIIRHTAQRCVVMDGAILTAIQRELACSTSNGEDADRSAEDELAEAVFTLLWFIDREYVTFEGSDLDSSAVRAIREVAFRRYPDRRQRYMDRLIQARSRDVLEGKAAA